MKLKEKEKILARQFRKKGLSVKEISKKLRVAKSSVSVWVRDVRLTKSQAKFLAHKVHLKAIIKRRVETRLTKEKARRQKIIDDHKSRIDKIGISKDQLIFLGSALYWAEGGKSDKNRIFSFYNSDPGMVRVMMVFLRKICKVPEQKFRGHVHLHPHLSVKKTEKFWSNVTNIPLTQFYKTNLSKNRVSKNTKDNLPYGTFSIQICSTDLYLRMLAWIEVVKEKTLTKYSSYNG